MRMIPWDDGFDHTAAQVLFHTNKLVLTWIQGEPMPPDLVADILKLIPAPAKRTILADLPKEAAGATAG